MYNEFETLYNMDDEWCRGEMDKLLGTACVEASIVINFNKWEIVSQAEFYQWIYSFILKIVLRKKLRIDVIWSVNEVWM